MLQEISAMSVTFHLRSSLIIRSSTMFLNCYLLDAFPFYEINCLSYKLLKLVLFNICGVEYTSLK